MDTTGKDQILVNVQRVLERIERAASSAGRDPKEIKLVVVTKGHPVDTVGWAIAAGLRTFGENYAEEGLRKIKAYSGVNGLNWHMIGHIQSRKAPIVCENYQWVHSLDSRKLANRLNIFSGELVYRLPVLLECNVSGEQTKFGWAAWEENAWHELLPEVEGVVGLPNIEVRGLMTMAPFSSNPEQARPYFQRLRRLQSFFEQHFPQSSWHELSMGMSDDFEVAVQEGATFVRIGTAILGTRPGQLG